MSKQWDIIQADIAEYLDGYDGPPFHAVFCDPPYGLGKEPDAAEVLRHWLAGDDFEQTGGGFMSKEWDSFVPGPATWKRIIEHVKPGAPLLAFGGTRTSDLLTMALRLAKFEIRDCLMWLYGQGFPKSHDVSKAIDAGVGAEREVINRGEPVGYTTANSFRAMNPSSKDYNSAGFRRGYKDAPATPEAERWDGYGTALKPSYEPVVLAMKPTDGTFAENALRHGVAGINVDGARIPGADGSGRWGAEQSGPSPTFGQVNGTGTSTRNPSGRWPSNVILQHHEDCVQRGVRRVKGQWSMKGTRKKGSWFVEDKPHEVKKYGDADGRETVAAWDCHPDCAVRMLAEMSGESGGGTYKFSGWRDGGNPDYTVGLNGKKNAPDNYGDTGTAARFFAQFQAESVCIICNMHWRRKHGIMNEIHNEENEPCENVSGAESSSSQDDGNSDFVATDVQDTGPPESAGKNQKSGSLAPNVESDLRTTQATIPSTVRETVARLLDEKSVLNARYAASLCGSCATRIVLNLVLIVTGTTKSLPYRDSTVAHKEQALSQSLANFAESQGSIDTILTIPTLKILFGYVRHAIDDSTKKEYHRRSGKSRQTRFRYQAKAHRRERDAGLAGMPERAALHGSGIDGGYASISNSKEPLRNHHPTVKPITLCKYLATLILPPPGDKPRRLIIPFCGSASEMIGALLAGWDEVVGVEMVPDYVDIARARLAAWMDAADRLQTTDVDAILDHLGALEKAERERQERIEAGQLPLFGGDV